MAAWEKIPLLPLGEATDDLEGIPYRLVIAKRAMVATYEAEDPREMIGDMLSDIRHLCDALGLEFGRIDRQANRTYTAEVNEAKTKTPPGGKA
jgi:hypothetical protein